ncbi:PD-(D/E)XK nuclease superfamily protein [Marinitoga hydrogenitolerans DSM 16785]|uniref:PD-(D/E)XK nuclease superfamily protein n=1 Tax=Marinitoga hydrogenitolerans (strain DSM 16785 / JCM 12826 / AT1271) TaxID=1122195 RepID=A0A1M4Y3D6_MARH1|nr:AAA family ATPase [Marinitoga hydrogenitolerans]SHF00208.1 PD-(D/E)XK nuclease superfamily protein [Marinitoga hydrogenitolerans DSM 16785]
MKLKRLPIGDSDFKTVIEDNAYYIDKSMLIKEVIIGGRVILITRPRRFGKTLNMSMLKYFFKNDQDNKHLFENLKIYEEKEIIEKHLNKYPVIYITFKDLKEKNYTEMISTLRKKISDLYREYVYLIESEKLNEWEKEDLKLIFGRKGNNTLYENSLLDLSRYLYKHHGKKAILLIDEYDTPIQQSYLKGYYDEFIVFIGNMLGNALKDNEYLEKAVLTGITRVAKESIFTGVNNLDISTVVNELYNDKFGVTKEELDEILKYYGIEYEKEKIMEWYNGFNFGGKEVYNPYSIINFVRSKEIKNYWINSSGNTLIKDLIRKGTEKIKIKIGELIEGKTIESTINENLVYGDLNENLEESIWTLFLFTGYLTWKDKKGEGNSALYRLKIPNKEAHDFYKMTVLNILKESSIEYNKIIRLLINGEKIEFTKEFKEIVENTLSYFDVTEKEPERFYHGLILGMSVGLEKDYIIKSNREAGYGRADLILIPKNKTKPGIIFEFKKYSRDFDKNLKDSAERGIKQIEEKGYEKEIKSYGIEKIIKVAIAFDKKDVEIIVK